VWKTVHERLETPELRRALKNGVLDTGLLDAALATRMARMMGFRNVACTTTSG
jgi:hypothetical protein